MLKMFKKKQFAGPSGATDEGSMDQRMSMKNIMKDIELLGTSRMTWKEKKELENRKVLSHGGKPQRNKRLSIREAGHIIKKQKKLEKKIKEEQLILGRFSMKLHGGTTKKTDDRRKPENMALKSSEGTFRNGVLDVKHLLQAGSTRESNSAFVFRGNDMMGDGNKKHGNGRGGGKGGEGKVVVAAVENGTIHSLYEYCSKYENFSKF